MPTYAVRDVETNDVRLVDASRPEAALKHVVTPRYNVTLASAADGVDAGKAGRSIEVAGAEPEAQPEPEQEAAREPAPALPPTLCGDPNAPLDHHPV